MRSIEERREAGPASLRWGVIGAGRWGRNIIRTLRDMPDARLSWVASRNPQTPEFLEGSCDVETEWTRALGRGDADVVAVATPPHVRAGIITAAVTAGLPVFAEKPLTLDLGEAERLLDVVARVDGYVMVDHVHLFSHAYRALKARLPGIGTLRRIRTEAGAWGPFRVDTPVLWDWGSHEAAFCLDLMGTLPLSVGARRTDRRFADGAWGETLELRAEYPGPVVADIRVGNLLHEKRRRLLVEGTGGALLYDDAADDKLVRRKEPGADAAPEAVAVVGEPPLAGALRHFGTTVGGRRTTLRDLRFGVDVVRILDAWDRACH